MIFGLKGVIVVIALKDLKLLSMVAMCFNSKATQKQEYFC